MFLLDKHMERKFHTTVHLVAAGERGAEMVSCAAGCGNEVRKNRAKTKKKGGVTYYFCSGDCKAEWEYEQSKKRKG